MSKNIVICCDGTGNEIEADSSNVLKLYRLLDKNDKQTVFYDPGIGTIGTQNAWFHYTQQIRQVFSLATGSGLDKNVLDTYRFLVEHYRPDDRIFLFGFSRGAYTVKGTCRPDTPHGPALASSDQFVQLRLQGL